MTIHIRTTLQLLIAVVLTYIASIVPAASSHDTPTEVSFSRTLYLVRHGAYASNDKADPETGPGLTALGIAQARLVAARLSAMPLHFSSITSSTMTRAKQTAAVMRETLSGIPLEASPLLSECTPPIRNPKVTKEAPSEGAIQCQTQLDEAFKTYFVPSKNADESDILVAHGNVIRLLVMKALGVEPQAWIGMSVAHASLTIVRVRRDGSMAVLSVGDIGHIPPNLQSWGSDADPQLVVPQTPPG